MFLNKENIKIYNKYYDTIEVRPNKTIEEICKKFNILEKDIYEKFIKEFNKKINTLAYKDFIKYIILYRNVLEEIYWIESNIFYKKYYLFLRRIWRDFNSKINTKEELIKAKQKVIDELYSIFEWCYNCFHDASKVWVVIDSLLWHPNRWNKEYSIYEYWENYYKKNYN